MTVITVMAAPRRETSFAIDFTKVEVAREVLGTKTLTETVDAALDEVINREHRRKFVEILSSGVLDLNDPEVMAGAWC